MSASMAAFEPQIFNEDDHGYSTESGGSDPAYDSDLDPSYGILEDARATFSKLSIGKQSKSRIREDLDVGVDENEEKVIENIIGAGQLEKLKVDQCKVYLRKNGLRLTGSKPTLIHRIKEHLEISNGGGEEKYPVSSFVLGCKGDACTGDVVMFEQNVYEMFNIAARSAGGPPCGKRIVAGRIVKESYGASKQQHTFSIEVLWSKGEKPLPPLHPLLIKGRNLYRLSTLRQRWEDEGERLKVLMEKHSRGLVARTNRDTRIHGKEKRKMLKAYGMSMNEDPKRYQSQMNSITAGKMEILPRQQPALHMHPNKMKSGPQQPSVQPLQPSLSVDSRKPAAQPHFSADSQSQMNSFTAGKVEILPRQQPALHMDSNKIKNGPQQPSAQPLLPSLSVDSRKLAAQLQFSVDSRKAAAIQHQLLTDPAKLLLQSLEHKSAAAMLNNNNSCQTQVPRNPVKLSSTSQVPNGPASPTNRQPLKSINQHHPTSSPQKQNSVKQQLCPYYPKGRCYFGDNCKFLHELRYKCDQRSDDRWHLGWHRQFERRPN